MTLEILVVAAYRILGSAPVLRWPFAGAILAIAVDLFDLLLISFLGWEGVPNYQALDKYLDQVMLALFLAVALRRWHGIEARVALALYLYRLIGFGAFELTGERAILLLFPNVFEFWFVLIASLHAAGRHVSWTAPRLLAVLAILLAVKEFQEWALHWARLFD